MNLSKNFTVEEISSSFSVRNLCRLRILLIYYYEMWRTKGQNVINKINAFLENRDNKGKTIGLDSVVSPDGKSFVDAIKIVDVPQQTASGNLLDEFEKATTIISSKTDWMKSSTTSFIVPPKHQRILSNQRLNNSDHNLEALVISTSSSTGYQ